MLNILIPIIFLMLSCYFDYKERRIPNEITYTMFVSGSIVQIATGGIRETLIGLLVMMFLLSFFGRAFKLGGGDTKLILACGTWLGNTSPYFLFFAFLSLLIYNCLFMIKKHGFGPFLKITGLEFLYGHTQSLDKVPGAFFITAGYLILVLASLR
jgi:Flp pilus assembly protein protease CpaA